MTEKVNVIVFDLDGTLVDLYGVPNWLDMLRNEDTTPYEIANPLYDMTELAQILSAFQEQGVTIAITTWTSKGGSRLYNRRVREAKLQWLEHYNVPYDVFHCVKYGTTKANCTRSLGGKQLLIDDNEQVRKNWHLGDTIDANFDIIKELYKLLCEE